MLKSDKFIKQRPLNEPANAAFIKDSQWRNKVVTEESIQCGSICIGGCSIQSGSRRENEF